MTSVLNLLQRLSGNSKLIPGLFIILALCFSSCSKKIFTGEGKEKEKRKEKDEKVAEETEVEEETGVSKREIPVVSLMLPFRLGQVDPGSASSLASFKRSELALDFYQGFKLGLDSLSEKGASFKLRVYDTQDETTAISRLVMKPELAESKLIVGPVFPSGVNIIGRYAQSHQIYFVSPLAPRVAVENNSYQIVATAPMEMHTNKAAEYIANQLRPSAVLVVSSSDAEESKYISSFMKQMAGKASGIPVSEVDVGSYGSKISSLKTRLSEGQLNVLVVPSQSATFWKILFTYLDMLPDSYRFAIIAHPGFAETEDMDLAKAEKYHVYVTSSGATVPKLQAAGAGFYQKYKEKYKVPPSEYAAKGFDVAIYFGTALWNGRNNITEGMEKSYSGYQNEFEFVQTPNGFINKGVKILKVQDYEFVEQK